MAATEEPGVVAWRTLALELAAILQAEDGAPAAPWDLEDAYQKGHRQGRLSLALQAPFLNKPEALTEAHRLGLAEGFRKGIEHANRMNEFQWDRLGEFDE